MVIVKYNTDLLPLQNSYGNIKFLMILITVFKC